jgi:hypothetical protein
VNPKAIERRIRMNFLKTHEPVDAADPLNHVYGTLTEMFGTVPGIFKSMSLRPDLLQPVVEFVKRLMIEDHELSRTTKELLAAHVSKLNSCAY